MLKDVKLNGIGDVFKPNALPDHTYVDRRIDEYGDTYTEQLQKALLNPGTLIAITGASKSGKTVLCHKAIRNTIIDLSASQIESREDFWNQIGEQLELPDEVQIKTSQSEVLSEENAKRLQNNIKFAERMGATIVTVYGEDVALQMAEYAKTSGATKIVIGRNATKRARIIRKPTLADKLIALATNIDIHIIPDADSDLREQKETLFKKTVEGLRQQYNRFWYMQIYSNRC